MASDAKTPAVEPAAAAAAGAGVAASVAAAAAPAKRFEVKKWNAVALWAWGASHSVLLLVSGDRCTDEREVSHSTDAGFITLPPGLQTSK